MIQQTFSVSDVAKAIGFPGGEKKFFEYLRIKGVLSSDNVPMQKHMDADRFKYEFKKVHPKITVGVPRVTLIGIEYLRRMVRKDFPSCVSCSKKGIK